MPRLLNGLTIPAPGPARVTIASTPVGGKMTKRRVTIAMVFDPLATSMTPIPGWHPPVALTVVPRMSDADARDALRLAMDLFDSDPARLDAIVGKAA